MPLSNEDSLRLNILCSQPVKAIRINDSSLVLTALTEKGEARIDLTPNQETTRYLREVREFLSEKYLGMPGGFPKHLGSWTRMGDAQNSPDKMLLLGEPEAVVALAYSGSVNSEQAAHAWWACQSAEIARNLLKNQAVVESKLGQELAAFLMEFLPFEEQPLNVVESVKLCLQKNLISAKQKQGLWARAKRKHPVFVGFLLAGAEAIPLSEAAHPKYPSLRSTLRNAQLDNNPYAQTFLYFLSGDGRKWLKSLSMSFEKLTEQDVVIALFISIDQTFDFSIGPTHGEPNINQALKTAARLCEDEQAPIEIQSLLRLLDQQQIEQFKALLVLAQIGENTLNNVFGGRDASGSVMRKHLMPLTNQINLAIQTLSS